jgi:hypothetical protein
MFSLQNFVSGFIATIFTAVSLWLGNTVNNMSKEITKLNVIMENQIKASDIYNKSIELLSDRLRNVEIELSKYSDIRDQIERLRLRMVELEKK